MEEIVLLAAFSFMLAFIILNSVHKFNGLFFIIYNSAICDYLQITVM